MSFPVRALVAAAVTVGVVLSPAATSAQTSTAVGPPTSPECLPLAGGSTGVLLVGGTIPSSDQVAGFDQEGTPGFGPEASAEVARTLPDRILFKDDRHTFSNDYAFALRHGRIYVRPATVGRGVPTEPWHVLELPTCLDGSVEAISADHNFLIALGEGRQLYSHDMPGGDLSADRWTWRWGPYFWTGSGMTMFGDVKRWATSEFNASERFTDTSGRENSPIGVGTVYLLRGDGRRITYLDPWLPQDESREVCGPRRGTLPLANLSGSGSVVFVVGQRGELWTRLYDFDVSGANTVFGDYAWERDRPADDTRWQLPGPEWVRHAAPAGVVTDRISIAKTGPHADDRVLRVEGKDSRGRTGYWQKQISAEDWRFTPTEDRLRGRTLPLADARTAFTPDDRWYAGSVAGRAATVRDFNPECSPARLRVQVTGRHALDLVLHSSDGMRQERRDQGLTDVPREYNGAIEVPARTWKRRAALPDAVQEWMSANLAGRFTTAPLAVTTTRLRFLAQCWELTLDGDPARPDQPGLPPDGGIVVGRLTETVKDGRQPAVCPPAP